MAHIGTEKKESTCFADYIQKIDDAVNDLMNLHCQVIQSDPLIAYRGESRDYGSTRLRPSLFRDRNYVEKEIHLFELFRDYNIVSQNASYIEMAIETQHYASISRMLDISFDMLIALYFACNNFDYNG